VNAEVTRSHAGWERLSDCPRCIACRPHLTRTAATALLAGTVYFAASQLGTALQGDGTTLAWIARGFDYPMPFCVSSAGLLSGCGRRR
jgi:hypothetical protein